MRINEVSFYLLQHQENNDKDIYVQKVQWLDVNHFSITTPTFVKIYEIGMNDQEKANGYLKKALDISFDPNIQKRLEK